MRTASWNKAGQTASAGVAGGAGAAAETGPVDSSPGLGEKDVPEAREP